MKILLLIQVAVGHARPGERTSLFLRRLAIQQERDRKQAELIAKRMKKSGFSLGKTPQLSEVPYSEEKISQAKTIETTHSQMANVGEKGGIKVIDPSEYSPSEKRFMQIAFAIAMNFGIEQVYLVSEKAVFSGVFRVFQGKYTMLLNRSLSNVFGKENTKEREFDSATNTVIHELVHLLEKQGNRTKMGLLQNAHFVIARLDRAIQKPTNLVAGMFLDSPNKSGNDSWKAFCNSPKIESLQLWQEGFIDHSINFTHQAVGRFAEAMKYAAAVSLANYEYDGRQLILPKQSASSGIRHSDYALEREESHPRLDSQDDKTGVSQSFGDTELGGIDLRGMPVVTQNRVGGLSSVFGGETSKINRTHLQKSTSKNLEERPPIGRNQITNPDNTSGLPLQGIDTDSFVRADDNWLQIEKMVNAEIIPSTERLGEYLVSSSLQDADSIGVDYDLPIMKVICCIAQILRIEEEKGLSTSQEFKQLLDLAESGRPLLKMHPL